MIGWLLGASGAIAAEITVVATNAIKEAYVDLVPRFEVTSGHKVTTTWAGTVELLKRLRSGETFDMVIASGPNIDMLIGEGKLASDSRADIVRSGVGVAVRTGSPRVDISSGEAVRKAVLAARSVAYSQGPSGVYIATLFKRWGIDDEIKPRLKIGKVGEPVGDIIVRGEADLGFQQISELLPVRGIDMLGPLPPDIQEITMFSAGRHANAKSIEAAAAWVKFLQGPEAAVVLKSKGMMPVT